MKKGESKPGPWNTDGIRFVEAPAKMEASVSAEEITSEIEKAVCKSGSPKPNRSKSTR
jgi:hypothetical protein